MSLRLCGYGTIKLCRYRRICCYAVILLVICISSCVENPSESVRKDFDKAYEAYCSDDMDTYFEYVDFGGEPDSIHSLIYRKAYEHNSSVMKQDGRELTSAEVTDVKFVNDTIALVFYTAHFGDGSAESCCHKMTKSGERWKIIVRN